MRSLSRRLSKQEQEPTAYMSAVGAPRATTRRTPSVSSTSSMSASAVAAVDAALSRIQDHRHGHHHPNPSRTTPLVNAQDDSARRHASADMPPAEDQSSAFWNEGHTMNQGHPSLRSTRSGRYDPPASSSEFMNRLKIIPARNDPAHRPSQPQLSRSQTAPIISSTSSAASTVVAQTSFAAPGRSVDRGARFTIKRSFWRVVRRVSRAAVAFAANIRRPWLPFGTFARLRAAVGLLMLTFQAFYLPMVPPYLAHSDDASILRATRAMNMLFEGWFLASIAVTMNTAVVNTDATIQDGAATISVPDSSSPSKYKVISWRDDPSGTAVAKLKAATRQDIVSQYLGRGLLLDLLSALPLEIVTSLVHQDPISRSSQRRLLVHRNSVLYCVGFVLRLLAFRNARRHFRVLKQNDETRANWRSRSHSWLMFASCCGFGWILGVHILACGWRGIIGWTTEVSNQLLWNTYLDDILHIASVILSFEVPIASTSSSSTDKGTRVSRTYLLFTRALSTVGFILIAIHANQMLSTEQHISGQQDKQMQAHVRALESRIKKLALPNHLQEKICKYSQHMWQTYGLIEGKDPISFSHLTDAVRGEIALTRYVGLFIQHSPWRRCSGELLRALALRLEIEVLLTGDVVLRKSEVSRRLLLLHHGILSVDQDEEGNAVHSKGSKSAANFVSGSILGQLAVLVDYRQLVTIRADTPVEICSLSRAGMEELLNTFTAERERLLRRMLGQALEDCDHPMLEGAVMWLSTIMRAAPRLHGAGVNTRDSHSTSTTELDQSPLSRNPGSADHHISPRDGAKLLMQALQLRHLPKTDLISLPLPLTLDVDETSDRDNPFGLLAAPRNPTLASRRSHRSRTPFQNPPVLVSRRSGSTATTSRSGASESVVLASNPSAVSVPSPSPSPSSQVDDTTAMTETSASLQEAMQRNLQSSLDVTSALQAVSDVVSLMNLRLERLEQRVSIALQASSAERPAVLFHGRKSSPSLVNFLRRRSSRRDSSDTSFAPDSNEFGSSRRARRSESDGNVSSDAGKREQAGHLDAPRVASSLDEDSNTLDSAMMSAAAAVRSSRGRQLMSRNSVNHVEVEDHASSDDDEKSGRGRQASGVSPVEPSSSLDGVSLSLSLSSVPPTDSSSSSRSASTRDLARNIALRRSTLRRQRSRSLDLTERQRLSQLRRSKTDTGTTTTAPQPHPQPQRRRSSVSTLADQIIRWSKLPTSPPATQQGSMTDAVGLTK